MNDRYDIFMTKYRKLHEACPICNSVEHMSTIVGYIFNYDEPDNYKDLNKCTCMNCGNIHLAHDRVEKK